MIKWNYTTASICYNDDVIAFRNELDKFGNSGWELTNMHWQFNGILKCMEVICTFKKPMI